MLVTKDKVELSDFLDGIDFTNNMLKNVGNGIYLSDNNIAVLKKYNIDYKKYSSQADLLFVIETYINDSNIADVNDLELLSMELSERNYYQNTRK